MNQDIHQIIRIIESKSEKLGITTYSGATEKEVDEFERKKGIKLPSEFRTLYKKFNGFESDEDMFRIIPLEEIIENKTDEYLSNKSDFHFAEYMIYCDMWQISVNPKLPENYVIYNTADDVIELTNSLSEFLTVFLEGGVFDGLFNWREKKSITKAKKS